MQTNINNFQNDDVLYYKGSVKQPNTLKFLFNFSLLRDSFWNYTK